MAACRQLGFDVTGNSAIRSADPENPTLEPNMKCIGSPVAEIWPFACLGGIWNPLLGGEVVWGQRWHHSKERYHCDRPQFAIECLRRLNQQVGGSIWAKISGVPLGVDPDVWASESEHPGLTNGEIISELFQLM